jgi:hypothetical protein
MLPRKVGCGPSLWEISGWTILVKDFPSMAKWTFPPSPIVCSKKRNHKNASKRHLKIVEEDAPLYIYIYIVIWRVYLYMHTYTPCLLAIVSGSHHIFSFFFVAFVWANNKHKLFSLVYIFFKLQYCVKNTHKHRGLGAKKIPLWRMRL